MLNKSDKEKENTMESQPKVRHFFGENFVRKKDVKENNQQQKKIYMPCGRCGVRPFICIYIIHSQCFGFYVFILTFVATFFVSSPPKKKTSPSHLCHNFHLIIFVLLFSFDTISFVIVVSLSPCCHNIYCAPCIFYYSPNVFVEFCINNNHFIRINIIYFLYECMRFANIQNHPNEATVTAIFMRIRFKSLKIYFIDTCNH